MSLGRNILQGTFWTSLNSVLSRGAALVTVAFVARILGTEGMGYYGIVASTVLLLEPLVAGPLGKMASRYVSFWKPTDREACGGVVVLVLSVAGTAGLLLMFGIFLAADLIAVHIVASPACASYFRLAAPFMFFGSLRTVSNGVLIGYRAFRQYALVNFVSAILTLPLTVYLVWQHGIIGAVLGLDFSALVASIMGMIMITKLSRLHEVKLRYRAALPLFGTLVIFALPAFLSGMMVGPVSWIGNAILIRIQDGASQMGLFSAANYLRGLALFLPAAIAPVMLPLMVEALASDQEGTELRRVAILNSRVIGMLVFPISIGMAAGSRAIIGVLYGPEFADGWIVLVFIACSIGWQALASSMGQILESRARMWIALGLNMWWSIVFVGLCLVLIPKYRATGLGLAFLGSYLQHMLMILVLRTTVLEVRCSGREVLLMTSGAVFMLLAVGTAYVLPTVWGAIAAVLLVAMSIVGLFVTGFDRQERTRVTSLLYGMTESKIRHLARWRNKHQKLSARDGTGAVKE